jgi:hypothetical protein
MLTRDGIEQWIEDRARQAAQHPIDNRVARRGVKWSRGDHYRRKNNGVALRTFRSIARWHDRIAP